MAHVCIYHRVDLDGFCSAAIVGKYVDEMLGDTVTYAGYNYGDDIPWDLITDNDVTMVDCSFQPDDMRRAQQLAKSLTWIDHHKSAIDACREAQIFPAGTRDTAKAGCELTWEFYFAGLGLPDTVYLLGRHDVWDLEADERVEPFQYAMRSYDCDPSRQPGKTIWQQLLTHNAMRDGFGRDPVFNLVQMGYDIQRYQKVQDAAAAKSAFATSIEGPNGKLYSAVAVNAAGRGSPIFDSIDTEPYDVMIVFRRTNKRSWAVSLYTQMDDVPCHEIAKMYGGGGHPGAAGFEITDGDLPFVY